MLFPVCFEVCRRKISSSKLLFFAPFKMPKANALQGIFHWRRGKKEARKWGLYLLTLNGYRYAPERTASLVRDLIRSASSTATSFTFADIFFFFFLLIFPNLCHNKARALIDERIKPLSGERKQDEARLDKKRTGLLLCVVGLCR